MKRLKWLLFTAFCISYLEGYSQSISISATINEGAENGSFINVTLSGATIDTDINSTYWSVSNLPAGVSKGTIDSISTTQVRIYLVGNRTTDYDVNRTNTSVTVDKAQITGGSNLTDNSGVTFTAFTEYLSITTDNVTEGNEDGKVIVVTLHGDTLANTLDKTKWSISNAPSGVTVGSVTRIDNFTAHVTLSGNRTADYDSDKTLSLTVDLNQFKYNNPNLTVSTGFTFQAVAESLTIPVQSVNEGSENGATFTVDLNGDIWDVTLDKANWTLNTAPQGVSISSVSRTDDNTATVTLAGPRTVDFDNNITLSLTVAQTEFSVNSSNISVSSGFTFNANNDAESISISGSATEVSENGDSVIVQLTGGTFKNPLQTSYFDLPNLPAGVSLSSVNRINSTKAQLVFSGNRTTDYDADITNLSVTLYTTGYDDASGGTDLTDNSGFTFQAVAESLSIPVQSVNEGSENGKTFTIDLNGDTWEATLNKNNWTLNTAPQGVSISSVSRTDDNTATVTLAGPRTVDYDNNITLSLTVASAEFTANTSNITVSSGFTFTANNDAESISISGSATEGSENGDSVIVQLTGGTFKNPLQTSYFDLTNLPGGVSLSSVNRINSTKAQLIFSGNRTSDYDSDITNLSLTLYTTGYDDASGGTDLTDNSGFTFQAVAESLTIPAQSVNEGSENGKTFTVDLNGDSWVATLNKNNWTLSTAPQGVSISSVSRTDNNTATVTLAGPRTVDYDTDITLSLTVAQAEFSLNTSNITVSSGFTFNANNDAESISISSSATEGSENGDSVIVQLTGGTFKNPLQTSYFNLTNLPAGVSLSSVNRINSTKAQLILSGTRTNDYDSDITNLSVTLYTIGYDDASGGSNLTDNSGFTFQAFAESLTIPVQSVAEESENGATFTVSLNGDIWAALLDKTNWTLNNAPQGVSISSVSRTNDNTTTVTLAGPRSVDFDNNITLSLTVKAAEFDVNSNDLTVSSGFTFTAFNDAESITLSGSVNEGSESTGYVTIDLTGGTFKNPLQTSYFTVSNLPDGVTTGSVTRVNNTQARLNFATSRTTDYDSDITNLTITLSTSGYDDATGGSSLAKNSGFTFTANPDAESISISGSASEGSEASDSVIVQLTNGTFKNPLQTSYFNLTNLPAGVSLSSVNRINSTKAQLIFSGNRTKDYDADITNLTIELLTTGYDDATTGVSLTASTGYTFVANNDPESISLAGTVTEGSENGAFITVNITGGTFKTGLALADFSWSALPSGVGIGSVTRVDNTTARLNFNSNRNIDFDQDITDLSVTLKTTGYDDAAGGSDLSASSGFTFDAIADVESIALSGLVTEGSELSNYVTVTLTGGTYKTGLSLSDFTYSNLPAGVGIGSVSRVSSTEARLIFNSNRTTDFDSDITNFTVTLKTSGYDDATAGSDLTANTGFTFDAINDVESITLSGSVTEESEAGNYVTVSLANGTLKSSLSLSDFSISNLPPGVTVGSVNYVNAQEARLNFSTNRSIDYDNNITNLSVTLKTTGYDDATSDPDRTASAGFTFTAIPDNESISLSGSANEGSEDGDYIVVTLTGGTYKSILQTSYFSVTNLPSGVTIGSVSRTSATEAWLYLSGKRKNDYDQNILNLSVTLSTSGYDDASGGSNLSVSTGYSFIANNDPESISLSGSADESSENGDYVTVKLAGGTFKNPLQLSYFNVTNLPAGVSIGSVSRIDSSEARLYFNGNRTIDYDVNINNLTVELLTSGYDDATSGTSLSSSSGFSFVANNDPETITLSGSTTEGNENGSYVTVSLSGGNYKAGISLADFLVENIPAGVSVSSLSVVSPIEIRIYFSGTSSSDYDQNLTQLKVTLKTTGFNDSTGDTDVSSSSGFTFIATNDPESIGLAWNNPPGTNGTELTIDNEKILVTLTGGTLNTSVVSPSTVLLSGNAITEAGISLESISNITAASFIVSLTHSGKDYDDDKTLILTLDDLAYEDGTGSIFNQITLPATFEPAVLSVSDDGLLEETKQNNERLTLTLVQDSFVIANVNTSTITITGLPSGVSVGSIQNITKNTLDIVLNGNSDTDYDSNIPVTIHVAPSAILQHNTAELTVGYTFIANNDPESIQLSWATIPGTDGSETTLDQEIISVKIIGGTLIPANINTTHVTLGANAATYGVAIKKIDNITREGFNIYLSFGGEDFDANWNITVNLSSTAYDDPSGNLSSPIQVTALQDAESLSLSWAPTPGTQGAEAGMNSEVVLVTINGGTFVSANLNPSTVTLSGSALNYGVSMESITPVDLRHFLIALNWNGTDYDVDKTLNVLLAASTYKDEGIALGGTITLPATNDPESLQLSWRNPPGNNGLEMRLDQEVIRVNITGGVFIPAKLNPSTLTLSGTAITDAGISLESVTNATQKSVDLLLAWNKTDFDLDKSLSLEVDTSAYRDGSFALPGQITVPATLEKIVLSGTLVEGKNLESDIQKGGDSLFLEIIGGYWKPASSGNFYNTSLANELFDGFVHISGFNDLKSITDTLKGSQSGGLNTALKRISNRVLLITFPPAPNYNIESDERFEIRIPMNLLDSTYSPVKTDPISIVETASTTSNIFGGGEICADGKQEATIYVSLGGQYPWRLSISRNGNFYRRFTNIQNNIFTFTTKDPGVYKVDTLQDANFIYYSGDVKITGSATVTINPLPDYMNITMNSAYSVDGSPVLLNPLGTPAPGHFYGPGVFNNNGNYRFYPSIADTSSVPHQIIYQYTDAKRCSNTDTAFVRVLSASGIISLPGNDNYFCYHDDPIIITGINLENNAGSFSISPSAVGFDSIGKNQIRITPSLLPNNTYTLSYTYEENGVEFTIEKGFTVEQPVELNFIQFTDTSFCKNEGQVPLSGNRTDAAFSGTGVNFIPGSGYQLFPSEITPGISSILYTYISPAPGGCTTQISRNIRVFDIPDVDFTVSDICISGSAGDSTQFLNQTQKAGLVESWEWNFGDGQATTAENLSVLFNPKHYYRTSGGKTIRLKATSSVLNNSCEVLRERVLDLGKKPTAAFSWNNECFNENIGIEFVNEGISETFSQDTFYWKFFNPQETSSYLIKEKDPVFTFDSLFSYRVDLIHVTRAGCRDTLTQTVNLRPTILLTDPYFEDFENGKAGWYPETKANSPQMSWDFGTPDYRNIKASKGGSTAWFTNFPNNKISEQSYVTSPCFNFSKSGKPMISMDVWRSLSNNRDGAVLQYTLNNGKDWLNVGTTDEGKNWYNSFQIVNGPDNQGIGWTYVTDTVWTTASHWLDFLRGETAVRFRIAYGSDGTSLTPNEGIAFDNIWVGEKNRRVLIEHFTSSASVLARSANNLVNTMVGAMPLNVIDIQYHLNIAGSDPMYLDNPDDPNARLLYYGFFKVPYSLVDGTLKFDYSAQNTLEQDYLYNRSIEEAPFDIQVNQELASGNLSIKGKVTALQNIPTQKISLHVAVVEKTITSLTGSNEETVFENVLKKMLPDAAGTNLNRSWKEGDSLNFTFNWTLKNVYQPDFLRLVVFLQNDQTREILQVATTDTTSMATGIQEPVKSGSRTFQIYPNPATTQIILSFDQEIDKDLPLALFDLSGRILENRIVQVGERVIDWNVSMLPPGVYLIRSLEPGGAVKKLMITER